MKPYFSNKKGFAAIYITVLILSVILGIALTISILSYDQQIISRNTVKSTQAYYTAEAGIEDALLRLNKHKNWSPDYNITLAGNTANIAISNIIGGSRTITSTGNSSDRIKKIQVIHQIAVDEISFYYGAQVGDGGMIMDNNTWVRGNVFSNGTVQSKVTGAGSIEDSIVVAGNGNKIVGLNIGKDAMAHTCENSNIGGTLTYVSGGGLTNCTFIDALKERPNEILPQPLPITQNQIDSWKLSAENGGTLVGDYTIPINATQSLGPKKIVGNLTLSNGSTLNMSGTIWVTGNIVINNGATIKLEPSVYSSNSGVIIADGTIDVRPNTFLMGSGQPGSYLLLLSTSASLDPDNPAINIENNTTATIFYTSQGVITLSNNIQVREVTGYMVYIKNNTQIIYEAGLENSAFSSGTGGGWQVASWKEIE